MVSRSAASGGPQNKAQRAVTRIDQNAPVNFTFDGRSYRGFAGDTLASALLANNVHLVGRSFKYHRPRGIMAAGSEEPNALIRLGKGAYAEPNLRATQIEIFEGLYAESQNRTPSLKFDIGAINSVLDRFFPAGFYYKTFMWPASMWMRYEHVIRHAAGLGKVADDHNDPDRYEKNHAHCDILVAGGGATGLMAALQAAKSGARVILADEQNEFGGWLLGEADIMIGDCPAFNWISDIVAELAAMPNVTLLPRTTVFGYLDHNYLTLNERVTDHLPSRKVPMNGHWFLQAMIFPVLCLPAQFAPISTAMAFVRDNAPSLFAIMMTPIAPRLICIMLARMSWLPTFGQRQPGRSCALSATPASKFCMAMPSLPPMALSVLKLRQSMTVLRRSLAILITVIVT